jgi:hypothetical protein
VRKEFSFGEKRWIFPNLVLSSCGIVGLGDMGSAVPLVNTGSSVVSYMESFYLKSTPTSNKKDQFVSISTS